MRFEGGIRALKGRNRRVSEGGDFLRTFSPLVSFRSVLPWPAAFAKATAGQGRPGLCSGGFSGRVTSHQLNPKIMHQQLFARSSALFFAVALVAGCNPSSTTNSVSVSADASGGARAAIQAAIDSLPEEGGTVFLSAGRYVLDGLVHINRSNVTLRGETGTVLALADGVKQANLLIGSDAQKPDPVNKIRHVTISGIEFDGNKDKQDSEFHPTKPWLRNNTIDIRGVDDLLIENVDCHDARSGGVVASWSCERIIIRASSFHHNFFDGIALYSSRDILVSGFFCFGNKSAALSLDNKLRNVTFSDGHIYENHDVGIFARDSTGLSFRDLQIYDNKLHGAFLGHQVYDKDHPRADEIVPNSGMIDNSFIGCSFHDNVGWGIFFASKPELSWGNSVSNCIFGGNTDGAIRKISPEVLVQGGNVILPKAPKAEPERSPANGE
jgi:hypothetical protein